jgi:hypothetical protein
VDRETALRLWTENATWFSNEEGKKGRIEAGQLADLIVPDRDYFACAESEIADTVSELTLVGGRIVYAAGIFASFDAPLPPAMPDWSPVRRIGANAASAEPRAMEIHRRRLDEACECAGACRVHGHDHGRAWAGTAPAYDLRSFWGALGCSCFAF